MSTDAVHIYLYYFLCAFGFSLSVPFIYIVIVKSPATLKVYRNTILNLTFWYLASMFAVVMLQPVHAMYGTKSCARFVGLVSLFDFEAHVAVIFCVGVSCENVAVAICVCFFYRYAQLRRMNMAASGSSFGLRLCLIGHIVGSIAMGSLGYVLVTYAEWKKVDGVYAMCFDDSNYFVIIRIANIQSKEWLRRILDNLFVVDWLREALQYLVQCFQCAPALPLDIQVLTPMEFFQHKHRTLDNLFVVGRLREALQHLVQCLHCAPALLLDIQFRTPMEFFQRKYRTRLLNKRWLRRTLDNQCAED
ncbi:hypothetical protein QR680_016284 [Steinernema hermaphroditum]|uniref:Uncharacterized protein n=1 Tax=Steinernema hermaphroditum TaxID=289476 RepID=A0AA39LMB3_9BILA|nr:hypothetical protein QR680_016284 [Steinernema hermaphroditum]